MAYSAAQQEKIDAAQERLDKAKQAHQSWVSSYNDWASSIQGCYKDQIPTANEASTWFNALSTGPCTNAGKGCTNSSITNCKSVIEKTLNAKTIPGLKGSYNELVAAQANFDKVLQEVATETATDPGFILQQQQQKIEGEVSKKKWATFTIVAIAILIFAYLIYKKA